MHALRYGREGRPVLYLPTSQGDQSEFQRYEMHRDCEPRIVSGKIQVFTVNAGGPVTLFNPSLAPHERIARYVAYENYVVDEVLPWIESLTGAGPPVIVGASYGAFVAANLLFRHPSRVALVCGLGGVYGMWHCLDGFHDDAVYFHTPLEYLPRLEDAAILEAIRGTGGLIMYAAEEDSWLASSHQLARVLQEKQLPHVLEVWKSPANHHEHWWRRQLNVFLERFD